MEVILRKTANMGSGIYIALLANYIGCWVILLLLLFFFLWKWFLSYLAYNKRELLFFSINVSVSSEKEMLRLQYFYNKSCVVSFYCCYWFKFQTNAKIIFLF